MADGPAAPGGEDALARSEARLRRAQTVARLGSWEIDLATRRMWGSDEAFRIYGLELTPDREMPLHLAQGVPLPEHRAQLDRALADLLSGARPYEEQFRIRRHSDGAIREIHSYAELVRDGAGKPVLVTGTLQDVTEREERARALLAAVRAGEERARIAFDQAADAIFIGNAAGDFVNANEKAVALTGYTHAEMRSMNMRDLFAPDVLRERPLQFGRVLAGEAVVTERPLTRKDGTSVQVEIHAAKLSDGTLQAIMRDVSERRRLEEQLQLRQRMDSVGTLASGIAHDFNNVLTGIMGYADALRAEPGALGAPQREAVDAILVSSRRAADLVTGLRDLARPRAAQGESYDVGAIAAEVFNVLAETTDRLVTKVQRIPRVRFHVRGSASGLYHALMNLGINAIQAIEQRGARPDDVISADAAEVTLAAGNRLGLPPGPWVHVTVEDTGAGMSPEVQRQAFDPLFTTKEKGERKGQGLGLSMVYNVVVRGHGGAIDVASAPGKGTAFHLWLPKGEPPAAAKTAAQVRAGPAEGGTILVVEDEPMISRLARRILERRGFAVLEAADGLAGVEVFASRAREIDLVLLDLTLPRLRGEEVLSRIRAIRPGVRVLVSSGDSGLEPSRLVDGISQLRKPYTGDELGEAVLGALGRG
jgi:two-component system cell cycle sensor histidine kinase/response regulator CckA